MEMTLDEVGQSFGVSKERIRQIERAALRKMRCKAFERGLRSDVDL